QPRLRRPQRYTAVEEIRRLTYIMKTPSSAAADEGVFRLGMRTAAAKSVCRPPFSIRRPLKGVAGLRFWYGGRLNDFPASVYYTAADKGSCRSPFTIRRPLTLF